MICWCLSQNKKTYFNYWFDSKCCHIEKRRIDVKKEIFMCNECGNRQACNSYCTSCSSTSVTPMLDSVPVCGATVYFDSLRLVSTGKLDTHGWLLVADPSDAGTTWGAIARWKTRGDK